MISAPVYFDGIALARDASELTVREVVPVVVRELAGGGRRQFVLPAEGGQPLLRPRIEVELDWESAGDYAFYIRAAVARPGIHQLILWQPVHLAWRGDGVRTRWELPWSLAAHSAEVPSGADVATTVASRADLLAGAADFDVVEVDAGEFAGAEPGAGICWISNGIRAIKTAPLEPGAYLYGRFVPVLEVLADQGGGAERRYTGPIREPQQLRLVEV